MGKRIIAQRRGRGTSTYRCKSHNYKTDVKHRHIDEIEKQPAYKRMGINLDETEKDDASISRTSLNSNDDDDIEFRSNNSFLHDNVD